MTASLDVIRLQEGRSPDASTVAILARLCSTETIQHAYPVFQERDPLAGAATLSRENMLWSAWAEAVSRLAQGRPLDALNRLIRAVKLHPLGTGEEATLVDVELHALMAECAEAGYRLPDALARCLAARTALLSGVLGRWGDGTTVGRATLGMVEVLTRTRIPADTASDWAQAWAVARGLHLVGNLGQQRSRLVAGIAGPEAADEAIDEMVADLLRLHDTSGVAFGSSELVEIDFMLGQCLTEHHPDEAFVYFDRVVESLGVEDGLGLSSAVNAANCLLRGGRFAEAEGRFGSLESLLEMRGDRAGAARVWIGECTANWKRLRDPGVRHPVAGAVKMFEESIGRRADPLTRFTQKRFIEPGYLLLLTANAFGADRSDDRCDEMLSAIWAVQSRDLLANLEAEVPEDEWEAMLKREGRPLAAMKTLLAPMRGVGIVHMVAGIDGLIWLVYGNDAAGTFRFSAAAFDAESTRPVMDLLEALEDQLTADKAGDALAVHNHGQRIEKLGSEIAGRLPADWRDVIDAMQLLIYMPHPFGNVDEFPIGVLRFDAMALADRVPIVRSPSVMHLRDTLSPARPGLAPNRRAVIVTGATTLGGDVLRGLDAQAEYIRGKALKAAGFEATWEQAARREQFLEWLDGGIGALHYIGHGIASETYEALPLPGDEHFGPLDADKLDGFRVPFVFICACVAARVRYGSGGYSVGTASKLVERGAPGVICFSMPIPEEHAYRLAKEFYRQARTRPLAEAVSETLRARAADVPAYARLAFTAYGDPDFQLSDMTGDGSVRLISQRATHWDSALRKYCVLRTTRTREALEQTLERAPDALRAIVRDWVMVAFQSPAASDESRLEGWERAVLSAQGATDAERLAVRAALISERAHASGIEQLPIYVDTSPPAIRRALDQALFVARLGGAFFDMGLNGLGCALAGRVITVDQNDAAPGALYLRMGLEKLLASEASSSFVRELRDGNARILEHFGQPV